METSLILVFWETWQPLLKGRTQMSLFLVDFDVRVLPTTSPLSPPFSCSFSRCTECLTN